ncbi:MAG: transcription-repair coupling factor [Candidatus Firestonebacteria bacterium RIFOXYC2_FULL_39_67]|nr:MAG: transcription-repair coupling factor [Candidatus Firestonebacteria bacterium RIFOXYD2_FULL_39_29]OGF51948.1 MAG: transcription-repair coupling factor [Candidatus Firestonebacteria bacterium RifOxyC12_full_39_7]OGF54829.1 MAG: transcription-repair coupling factor [Candidatus Firestonebacteria bacterium RIFOXYC2_FULL_39_67]
MDDNKLKGLLLKSEAYLELLKKITENDLTKISGIKSSADAFFTYSLNKDTSRPVILVLPDNDSALRVYYDLQTFIEEGVFIFPAVEELEGVRLPASNEITEQRITGIKELLHGKFKAAVFTGASFLQSVPERKAFEGSIFKLGKGEEIKLVELVENLIRSGFTMEAFVEKKGEVSVRGGILDVFPFTEEHPVRVDFLGDTIETIKIFDLVTQKSIKEQEKVIIYPAGESGFPEGELLKYLPPDSIIYMEEQIFEDTKIPRVKGFSCIFNVHFNKADIVFNVKSNPSSNGDVSLAISGLEKLKENGTEVFLLFNSLGEKERFAEILLDSKSSFTGVYLDGSLQTGFNFTDAGVCFITDNEIFGRYANVRPAARRRKRFFKDGTPVKSVFEINTGEIVVHENYGIAKFLGLHSINVAGAKKDFVTLEYLNNDKLYVPVEDINKIQKYVGFEEKPVLSNLGTSQWEKAKEKAKEDVKKMATDLLELYAVRETLKGYSFSRDTEWQKEFEGSFMYEETKDQLRSVKEVKDDMEKGRPIDRLVCGDVGFGKTEVALRAAFKCAMDGKQTAFVCPTTILAEQHYNTFKERMADYPVSIGMLSRFGSKKEHTKTIAKLKTGGVDIVIGTHRLLQDDICFKDLGMIILDDEQKFGVAQKEKLKKIKQSVYCLSLSATPIPRTLYLSLSGIREISNINTPPAGRMPIQTYIIEYNEKLIKGAILKELKRGGEVYYVYNQVKTIKRAAARLARLVPEAKIAVAHGQLPGPELEKIMRDFYKKKYNVLVCSTIIEAGLDNPSANTIIIENADDLGLSQLYQLRGRVGRSRVQAYAYFTYPVKRALSETAMKRLNAIEECDELSMGYSIAMKDLEIRGAGNILGREQHGQIGKVGLELYMKLLKEAVNSAKGLPEIMAEENIEIDIKINAYLPEYYVKDSFLKINIYKDMMGAETPEETEKIKEELLDRFGKLPLETENLLKIVKIRIAAKILDITSIREEGNSIHFEMKKDGRGSFKTSPSDKLNDALNYFTKFADIRSLK